MPCAFRSKAILFFSSCTLLCACSSSGGGGEAPAPDTYVFERETGEPLFPIEEVPVPAASLDGEEAWPTQPVPSAPPPFTRTRMSEEEVTDITPSAHAAVKAALQGTRYGSQFIPLSEKPTVVFPGMIGGAEWGGGRPTTPITACSMSTPTKCPMS